MPVKEKVSRFDLAEYLTDEERITAYLATVLEDGSPEEILRALHNIAKARGISQLAKDTGLGRESLYKTLAEGSKPRFETILKIMRALGVNLTAKPISSLS